MIRVVTSLRSPQAEYTTITRRCGLLDRSERGKLALGGADAKTFLQGQVTNDVESLKPGSGCYAAFLTPKGKMLGDLRILDAGDELLLDTERLALQDLFNMIQRFSIGYDVQLHKRTLQRALLSLIGPEADAVLQASDGAAPAIGGIGGTLGGREHDHVSLPSLARARSGPTSGSISYSKAASSTPSVQRCSGAGALEVGEDAAECLRIERGRPRYGVDLDNTVIPQEAGLNERAVSFTKGCYVGQETVARLFYRGKPNRRLCGLLATEPVTPGMQITYDDRAAGKVTSVADLPPLRPDRARAGSP